MTWGLGVELSSYSLGNGQNGNIILTPTRLSASLLLLLDHTLINDSKRGVGKSKLHGPLSAMRNPETNLSIPKFIPGALCGGSQVLSDTCHHKTTQSMSELGEPLLYRGVWRRLSASLLDLATLANKATPDLQSPTNT